MKNILNLEHHKRNIGWWIKLATNVQGLLLPDMQLKKDMQMTNDIQPNSERPAGGSSKPPVSSSTVFNEDCMTVMARYPDKFFDLAVVDPPYGIEWNNVFYNDLSKTKKGVGDWDKKPDEKYFIELKRVSKNWIIFGINYFIELLKEPFSPIVWDKKNGDTHIADGELAGTSIKKPLRIFSHAYFGRYHPEPNKIHPTQKPTALYDFLFLNYGNGCNKILDTHLGSGSSRIAAHKHNLEFVGCEINAEYFAAQEARFKEFTSQLRLFG